jgi:hypothetical protein
MRIHNRGEQRHTEKMGQEGTRGSRGRRRVQIQVKQGARRERTDTSRKKVIQQQQQREKRPKKT